MNNKLSEKPWGDVDKDELLKFVINHPKMADKIYLKIEKDWQDNPRERLSYPIADKNGTVYRYVLSSALTYAKANNETEVVKKVKDLYKKYNISEELCIMEKHRLIIEGLENSRIDEAFNGKKFAELYDKLWNKCTKETNDKKEKEYRKALDEIEEILDKSDDNSGDVDKAFDSLSSADKEKLKLLILDCGNLSESKVTEGFQMTFGASICKSGKKLFATNYDTCVVYEAIDVESGKKDGIIITNEYNGKAKFGAWLSSSEIDDFKKLLNKF